MQEKTDALPGEDVPKVDVTQAQDGGIIKQIKRAGSDPDCKALKGDKVKVHYVGTLQDGSKFDSSRDRGDQPFTFDLGRGQVIKGWDEGVASMTKGELAVFTITAPYAYGENGAPPKIPPGATLIFEVELLGFEGEDVTKDKDGGVTKRTFESGDGLDHPNDGAMVDVEFKGKYSGNKEFDNRSIKFNIGDGLDVDIPVGLETGICRMKKGERAELTVDPKYGFGKDGRKSKGVPGDSQLVYDITLKSFERAKEGWQLDGDQKLEQSRLFKEKGTVFFKAGKYEMARKKYDKIIEYLEHEISLKDEKEDERKDLLQAGRLNLAMCHLKGEEWIEARNVCDKVISENAAAEKAYFRRGEARMRLNDHEPAREDFAKCVELDPENAAAKKRMAACAQFIRAQRAKEKKTFANMFDRFAKEDAEKEERAKRQKKPLEINEWSENKDGSGAAGPSGISGAESINVTGDIKMDIDLNKELSAAAAAEGGDDNLENANPKN